MSDVNEAMAAIQDVSQTAPAMKELLRGAIRSGGDAHNFDFVTRSLAVSFGRVLGINFWEVRDWAADIAQDLLVDFVQLNKGDISVDLDTFAEMQFPLDIPVGKV